MKLNIKQDSSSNSISNLNSDSNGPSPEQSPNSFLMQEITEGYRIDLYGNQQVIVE